MKKSEVFNYYKRCKDLLEETYKTIQGFYGENDTKDICTLRGYITDGMGDWLKSWGIGYSSGLDIFEGAEDVGVFKKDRYLLEDRYIIPIRGINNDLLALVGWTVGNDAHKYVTTPSPFFSKDLLLFNFNNCLGEDVVFLVEGLFDAISLGMIGIPAVAAMGATLSSRQAELLKCFKKVVAIPDADASGRKALVKWRVPSNTVRVKLTDTTGMCKDMDNMVQLYEKDSIHEVLYGLAEEHGIVELKL